MNSVNLLDSYFNSTFTGFDVYTFLVDMSFVTVLGFILGLVYLRFSTTIASKKTFVIIFPVLALATMVIISVIKSSLALSLGLVGALSIVRFRAAIKEPEELVYLFLAITLGLGFGATQKYLTVVAFIFIISILIIRGLLLRRNYLQNLFLTISNSDNLDIDKLVKLLDKHTEMLSIKRVDSSTDFSEIVFYVRFKNLNSLNNAKSELEKNFNSIRLSFIEDKGIFN